MYSYTLIGYISSKNIKLYIPIYTCYKSLSYIYYVPKIMFNHVIRMSLLPLGLTET